MPERVHSRETVIIIDDNDISVFCTDSNCEESGGTEDNTTYGKDALVFDPTMKTGAFGCSGKYDAAAAGPRAVLKPLVNTKVNVKHRPEGTGSGLPQDSFDAVITAYTETAPVAGYRTWALTTQPSDVWDSTDQT
jgi:hypothetical protein